MKIGRKTWDFTRRYPTSMLISSDTRRILCAVAVHLGISRADVIEMAVRSLARRVLGRGSNVP